MKKYDILIVGSGFVGSSLAEYLHSFFNVATISRNAQPKWLQKYNIDHKICDIRDYNKLFRMIENPAIIIHTAITRIPETNMDKKTAYEVNVLGLQNVCQIVASNPNIVGLILTSSMGVLGEKNLIGTVDEEYGYHPEKVEVNSISYNLSKIIQECIVRSYDEKFTKKCFGILRFDSVIGERMHKDFFVNRFIDQGLNDGKITPYKSSRYRPVVFTAIEDICISMKSIIKLILNNTEFQKDNKNHIFNLIYPKPYTIEEIADIIMQSIIKHSKGKILPEVKIIDKEIGEIYEKNEKKNLRFDISKTLKLLEIDDATNPIIEIDKLIKKKLVE